LLYKLIVLLNSSHLVYFVRYSVYLRQQLSIMQQFGTSMFTCSALR